MVEHTEGKQEIPHAPWIVGGLVLLALAVRLWDLGLHSFWFDEAREVLRASMGWPDVLFVTDGADPPVYRLLLFPLAELTSQEFWLRLPSALFGAAAVFLSFWWLRDLGLPRLGIFLAALLSVASIFVYYSQEVSQYSLVIFLALVLLITFERAGRLGTPWSWVWVTAGAILSIYTYYGLAWLLPALDAHLGWRVWRRRRKVDLAGFAGFHVAVAASIGLLYAALLSTHINRFTTNKELEPAYVTYGPLNALRLLDDQLLHNISNFFAYAFSLSVPRWINVAIFALFILGSIVLALRAPRQRWLAFYLWGTIGVLYGAWFVGVYPLGSRYALAIFPLYFLAFAALVDLLWSWRRVAGLLLLLPLIGWQALFLPQLAESGVNPWLDVPRENLRPVVTYLNREIEPGDVIYVYYGAVPAYDVYQETDRFPTTRGPWFRSWPLEERVADIQGAVEGNPRFWMVLSHVLGDEREQLIQGLAESSPSYVVQQRYDAEDAAALLFVRRE